MPGLNSFRQVDEKHVAFEVDLMLWSPKMDLIAVAGVTGEVALHRLSWQKVWTLSAPSETSKVTSLAWRPDGKVLAVGYSTGKIHLCDVENASCLQSLQLTSSVSCLIWSSDVNANTDEGDTNCFQDMSNHYLPQLPTFEKSYTDASKGQREVAAEDAKKLQGQSSLNVLLAGSDNGQLALFAYGVVHLALLDLSHFGVYNVGKIVCAHLADDFKTLSVITESNDTVKDSVAGLHFLAFDSSLLASRCKELHILCLKLGQILTLLSYMETTINQMSEAWEDILLEMDSKLKTLAEEKYKVCGGSLSTDFLRLLMFGKPSDELKNFLLFSLTDKGLKKLGHSIETSYTNIQQLLLKHLQSVGQSIIYHISDVKGMSHWHDKFGDVGLSLEATGHAVGMAGSFMLKSSELQQVIDTSLKNFKAFFRWLYVTIMKLAEEPVPSALIKMSQQDLNFVAQFLRDNFTEDVTRDKSGFKLEKVGQYLKRQNLYKTVDTSANAWEKFLAQNALLRESPLLFSSFPELSLVQMYDKLATSVDEMIQHTTKTMSSSIRCVGNVYLHSTNITRPFRTKITQRCAGVVGSRYIQTSFALIGDEQPEQFYISRQYAAGDKRDFELAALKCSRLSISPETDDDNQCRRHALLDLSFYDDKTLSLLLQEADCRASRPTLVLLPVALLDADTSVYTVCSQARVCLDDISNVVDITSMADSVGFRTLDNLKASKFAISGTRKVACVLFASRRRVRLFLLDVEDEDDDEHIDVSQHDAKNNSKDLTDDSLTVAVVDNDDENKENSSDMTVDPL